MTETQEDSTTLRTHPTNTILSQKGLEKYVHNCSGNISVCTHPKHNNTCMYTIVKGKPMYSKKDTDWVRTRPSNSDIKQCRGC
jgi:hypothetical protein